MTQRRKDSQTVAVVKLFAQRLMSGTGLMTCRPICSGPICDQMQSFR